MAAPTSVRVEATSQTSAVIRWAYAGSASIAVYRSTDGSSYSEVTSVGTRVAAGTTSYTDETLEPGTKYWYKLSDDVGSTFSSVVTVYSHSCLEPAGDTNTLILPRTNGEEPTAEFDELAERIERTLNGRVLNPQQCVACPEDGAIVIDCSQGCNDWVVVADEDINSITVNWCGEGTGTVEFIIPPNTTRCIGGWPSGFGFSGDEAQQACLVSGSSGMTMSVGLGSGGRGDPSSTRSRRGYNPGIGNGGGTGSGCNCVPTANGGLTIKSCNPGNSLKCSTTKSLKLLVCGGKGPYSWSRTGSVGLRGSTGSPGSTASGTAITVTPPTNSGPAVSGTAYWVDCYVCGTCSSGTCTSASVGVGGEYDCNDVWTSALPGDPSPCDRIATCSPALSAGLLSGCCSGNTSACVTVPCVDVRTGCPSGVTKMCDQRSAGMISDGCNPCGLQQGATVTVTDALGTQTTIVLTA